MRTTKFFSEKEMLAIIKRALADQGHIVKSVSFNVTESRDALDRSIGGFDVETEVEIDEPFPLEIPK